MIWKVPWNAAVDASMEPGTWALNPDFEYRLARYINDRLDHAVFLEDTYENWSSLPLIVLAGLR